MINELAIHMPRCFGMIKLGIIYLLPKYFDYNPLNIILKRLIYKTGFPGGDPGKILNFAG